MQPRLLPLLLIGTALLISCSDEEPGGDAERFCGEIELNQQQITDPDLSTEVDIALLLDLYREIGALAPISIEQEWDQLTLNYETASTVVPGDDASMQAAVAMALRSEQAAASVKQWLVDNCALDIGPVATIAAQT